MLADDLFKVKGSTSASTKKARTKPATSPKTKPLGPVATYNEEFSAELNFSNSLVQQNQYCAGNGSIYSWSSWYWQDTEDIAKDWAKKQATRYLSVHAPDRVASSVVNSSVSIARYSLPDLPKSPKDTDKTIIPLIGTWLEVKDDGSIVYKNPDRSIGITYALKVSLPPSEGEYVPGELPEGSLFKGYLDVFMANPEHQKLLQEYAGYTLTPGTKRQKALLLQGEGGEGKSVFIDILSGIHQKVEVIDVSDKDTRKPASLAAASLIICPEVGKQNFQLEFFKSIVVGDKVKLRNLYQDEISTVIGAKCVFSFNNFPIVNDKTNGFWRRVILFKLTNKIPANKINVNLSREILAKESKIVLDWALAGLQRLTKQNGFTNVPELEAGLAEWKTSQNTVAQFLEEVEFALHPTAFLPKVELYQRYRKFCVDRGNQPVSNEGFYTDLKRAYPNLLEKKVMVEKERTRMVFCELKSILTE
ncbi:DNA primase family protein [Variovorax sp. W2I14]|uniref:DNA primase family protein n=1 Tax=Variovorax sp. W2I14 TaxID=3042290 RepID=UPI003D1B7D45